MYSINGIALDNEPFGWVFRGPSKPLSELVKQAQSLSTPGRDELVPLPSTFESPVLSLVVQTPRENLETLYAVFLQANPMLSLTDVPWRSVAVEYLGASLEGYGLADGLVDVTFMVRLNGVFWRDADESTSAAVSLSAASVIVPVFPGGSASVRDAIIRVAGQASGLKVADAAGSWFSYPASLPAGSFLRFESDTGHAFTTTTDVWTGGTEVTGVVVNGPGPYFLEMTPTFVDPASRSAKLTVTTTARSGASIQVRGRGAYLV